MPDGPAAVGSYGLDGFIGSDPDHDRRMAVTLHRYGRNLNSFHVYDVDRGTRRLVDVPHHETGWIALAQG
jgi:hypothetical protein